jgi:hypothetical protein
MREGRVRDETGIEPPLRKYMISFVASIASAHIPCDLPSVVVVLYAVSYRRPAHLAVLRISALEIVSVMFSDGARMLR